jgi:hypothetical protein
LPRTPEQHSADSKAAAYTLWGGITNRTEQLRETHENSPSGFSWHARRLLGPDVDVDALTPLVRKQVEDARLAWLRANQLRAVKAGKRKSADRRAMREAEHEADIAAREAELAAELARMEAEVAEAGETP